MTLYGPDTSNNNWSSAAECTAAMAQIKSEGFSWVEAKVSEGNYYQDPYWPVTKAACAAQGLGVVGYHYVTTDPAASQAATFAGNGGGLQAMLDFEANSGNIANFWSVVNAFNALGIEVVLSYIPHWYWQQIGSPDLSQVPGLVASSYVNGTGYASSLYPGDASSYWAAYGGATPQILQFTDAASIAGLSIDANAYIGTDTQLLTLLGQGTPPVTAPATPTLAQLLEILTDIQMQQRGPGLQGWPQLGQNAAGQNLTEVDALGAIKILIEDIHTAVVPNAAAAKAAAIAKVTAHTTIPVGAGTHYLGKTTPKGK